MNRITAALYRFLVVYLSVAMVVTSIPLAPSTAYADDSSALAVESEAQEADSDSDTDADAVDDPSSANEGSSSAASASTDSSQDKSSSSDTNTLASSLAQDLASDATDSDAAKSLAAMAEPSSDDSEVDALTYEDHTIYQYAKLMPSGYVYPCDPDGNIAVKIDESKPYKNSVDGRWVSGLIVDYGTDEVPAQLCEGSIYLHSVRFENKSISKIGRNAFYGCSSLFDVYLSGMTIGSIESGAFFGCRSLGGLGYGEITTIGSMG